MLTASQLTALAAELEAALTARAVEDAAALAPVLRDFVVGRHMVTQRGDVFAIQKRYGMAGFQDTADLSVGAFLESSDGQEAIQIAQGILAAQ